MARYIHCKSCNDNMTKSASRYGEYYESLEGTAKKDLRCDGTCGVEESTLIKEGDTCFAAVLLDTNTHPNYKAQKPDNWASEYINVAASKLKQP